MPCGVKTGFGLFSSAAMPRTSRGTAALRAKRSLGSRFVEPPHFGGLNHVDDKDKAPKGALSLSSGLVDSFRTSVEVRQMVYEVSGAARLADKGQV